MESTYTQSTISKFQDKEETIKFVDECDLEDQQHRGRTKIRRYSFHSRHSSSTNKTTNISSPPKT